VVTDATATVRRDAGVESRKEASMSTAAPPISAAFTRPYPATLDARFDEPVSRWKWLVKWFLAIPHYVVLCILWIAFVLVTIGAFFSILFTGRYPRGMFEFNVGVMRWTWRVAYYSTTALGTDRYPPFSLGPEPGYPATLDVEYPERLSQWKPLVKWLFAIPQLIVVGLFMGGSGFFSCGVVGILTLVGIVMYAFRRVYPQEIFDFVVGMARWSLRVGAYVALMRDEYPPFRLDTGGTDPGSTPAAVAPDPDPATAQ
jgi:Domain of unknown function (DUF4389)